MSTFTKTQSGGNGTFAGNKTGTRNGKFIAFFIPSTCTISKLLNKDGADVTTKYIWDKTAAVEGPVYIHADEEDVYFTQVINTAGAFNANNYKKEA